MELHCHTNFSLCNGASHPEELVKRAAEMGMPALALTDHDALRCQRRIQAARRLFRDGDLDEAEYDKILRECDQEIESWNQITGEQEQVEYELKMCVESLTRLAALWIQAMPNSDKG